MQYRVQVTVNPVSGASSFGYPIYLGLYINGVGRTSVTLKAASPSRWTSAIVWTSDWYTVADKTSGTTPASFNLYSGSGSSRNSTPRVRGKDEAAASLAVAPMDHPRVCGEKFGVLDHDGNRQGSPPRVRGKVVLDLNEFHRRGITPACAGKSRPLPSTPENARDHPRVCGEKRKFDRTSSIFWPITPRVRGKARFSTGRLD